METAPSVNGLSVHVRRVDDRESICRRAGTSISISTHAAEHRDALNPAELLLASVAGCLVKGVGSVALNMQFALRGVDAIVEGQRQEVPPRLTAIHYRLLIDTDESPARLQEMHRQLRLQSTICRTLSAGLPVEGDILRAADVIDDQ